MSRLTFVCPCCGHPHALLLLRRLMTEPAVIHRLYQCLRCLEHWATCEMRAHAFKQLSKVATVELEIEPVDPATRRTP